MLARAAHTARTLTVRHTGDFSKPGRTQGGAVSTTETAVAEDPGLEGGSGLPEAPGPQRLRQLHRRDRDQHHRDRDHAHPAPPPGSGGLRNLRPRRQRGGLSAAVRHGLRRRDDPAGRRGCAPPAQGRHRHAQHELLRALDPRVRGAARRLRRRGPVPAAVQRPRRARQRHRHHLRDPRGGPGHLDPVRHPWRGAGGLPALRLAVDLQRERDGARRRWRLRRGRPRLRPGRRRHRQRRGRAGAALRPLVAGPQARTRRTALTTTGRAPPPAGHHA